MKKIKIIFISLIAVLCLFGCSSKTSEKQEVTNNAQQENKQEGNNNQPPEGDFKNMGMMGTISEIDIENNTITIKTNNPGMQGGNMPGGDKQEPPEMTGGEQPEMPSGDKQQPPEMPEATDKVNAPEGQENFNPDNKPEGTNPQQMPNAETSVTYNITEVTVIKDASGNEITINDLKVDDFIEYTLDGENLLTANIINFDSMPQMASSNS